MALTVQTNTKKYCSYLFNNIDFSDKRFNFLMFYIYLFMFYFTILCFLTIEQSQTIFITKYGAWTFKISRPYNYTYKPFRVNRRRAATPGTILFHSTPTCQWPCKLTCTCWLLQQYIFLPLSTCFYHFTIFEFNNSK